jgi:hypothetical protein
MAVPTSNIKFSDIATEAGGYSGMLSLLTMSFFSYFSGPNGSSAQPYNNWGQGEASGDNRIYGTTAKTTNIKVSDFSGLNYFYLYPDYQVYCNFVNNSPFPTTPPDPPDAYDMNVNLILTDSSVTYLYCNGGGLLFPGGGQYLSDIASSGTPLINNLFWSIDISPSPSYAMVPTVRADIDINGTNYVAGAIINPGSNIFDFSTYGSANITVGYPAGATGSEFTVTIY